MKKGRRAKVSGYLWGKDQKEQSRSEKALRQEHPGMFEKEQEVGLHSCSQSVVRIEVTGKTPRLISISPRTFYSTVNHKPGIWRCAKGGQLLLSARIPHAVEPASFPGKDWVRQATVNVIQTSVKTAEIRS